MGLHDLLLMVEQSAVQLRIFYMPDNDCIKVCITKGQRRCDVCLSTEVLLTGICPDQYAFNDIADAIKCVCQ